LHGRRTIPPVITGKFGKGFFYLFIYFLLVGRGYFEELVYFFFGKLGISDIF